jgi:hypothetical protein
MTSTPSSHATALVASSLRTHTRTHTRHPEKWHLQRRISYHLYHQLPFSSIALHPQRRASSSNQSTPLLALLPSLSIQKSPPPKPFASRPVATRYPTSDPAALPSPLSGVKNLPLTQIYNYQVYISSFFFFESFLLHLLDVSLLVRLVRLFLVSSERCIT